MSAEREKKMVDKRTWEEFRDSGMLWWANRILHVFGWAIVCIVEEKSEGEGFDGGSVLEAWPARVKFRGFDEKSEEEGFIKVTEFFVREADVLRKEVEDE